MKYVVAVARPTGNGWERVEIGNSLIEIVAQSLTNSNVAPWIDDVIHVPIQQFPTNTARNTLVKSCQEKRVDFLFMLDVDGAPKANTFQALFTFLRQQPVPSVAGVPYISGDGSVQVFEFTTKQLHNGPLETWALTRIDKNRASLMQGTGFGRVASLGTHCVMYDMRVFDKIKPPYFQYGYNEDHTAVVETEDCWNFRHLFHAGVPVWCAWDYPARHFKEIALDIMPPLPLEMIPAFYQERAIVHAEHKASLPIEPPSNGRLMSPVEVGR